MISARSEAVLNLMIEASERFILPKFRALADHEVESKSGPLDLVTIADQETEEWLSRNLMDLVPGSVVLGEEAYSRGEVGFDILDSDALVWILDPVDGTRNFATGNQNFASMAALAYQGQILGAWVLKPLQAYVQVAERAAGAFWRQGEGEWHRMRNEARPAAELAGYGSAFFRRLDPDARVYDWGNLSCSGVEYQQVASGLCDFALHFHSQPWDHAAGILLVEEAGGQVLALDSKGQAGKWDPRTRHNPILALRHESAAERLLPSLMNR